MAKLQIKKGDTVVVISGKDKGKQGTVIAIHVSNVMVVDPETKTATRIKKVEGKDGKFVRATVKSGTVLK